MTRHGTAIHEHDAPLWALHKRLHRTRHKPYKPLPLVPQPRHEAQVLLIVMRGAGGSGGSRRSGGARNQASRLCSIAGVFRRRRSILGSATAPSQRGRHGTESSHCAVEEVLTCDRLFWGGR